MKKQTNREYKKLTPEQLQGLLHLRRRGYADRNGKTYTRKQKHKNKKDE